ncbi:MAG: DNA cytosine methyltransferase [Candidatus Riesia sp.]|nr:DNA cytosine methyltransferase [Candidatus Riesia sp.]
MDRAFLDEGFTVIPGCEIDPEQRDTYYKLNGKKPLFHSFEEMDIACDKYELVIGGPPCQSLSRTKRDMKPKFKDFTEELLAWGTPKNYLYENVKPLKIPGSNSYLCDAMH